MTETISEQVGLTKVVDGTNKRTVQRPVTVESENREYVGDKAKLDALPMPGPVVRGCGDGEHPSPFHADPLYRGTTNPSLVRRSLTWREAVKAVFSREINRPLVAVEVEIEGVFDDGNFNAEDSFV